MSQINIFKLYSKEIIPSSIIILFIFLADRLTKIKAINFLSDIKAVYINDFLNLNLTFNTGIGFGFFSLKTGLIYNLISLFILLVIIYLIYLMANSNRTDKILYSLILGGALGNFYDRALYFAVPDFIDLHYKEFHWFTFNIADIFITLGIIALISNEILLKNE